MKEKHEALDFCCSSDLCFDSLHAGKFYMLFLSSSDFISKLTFSKNSYRNTVCVQIRENLCFQIILTVELFVSRSGPTFFLQRLSADNFRKA